MKIFKRAICASLFVTLLLLANAPINAQGTFSRFTGVVQDVNGASVPGATVTLTNEATNVSQTTQTSESGVYTFDSIQVGTYRIEIEKTGFKKFVSGNNNVNAAQATTLDVRLEIGDVSAVVEVENAAELVQTSSSGNIGNVVEQQSLEALPIVGSRGRNPLSFINLQPGVTVGSNTGGGVHVHGSRDRAFNFTLDGIDNNDPSAGGSNFTPTRTNPDALTEFQVITSNFTAELGRSSGASVALVTRAGTNDFRGNAFWFYQTPELHANEYENNLNNVAKRQFVQHIFGGSFGGPIIKNKAFFFTNLQLLRASETRLVTRTVYTPLARQGIFRYVAGSQNRPSGVAGASVDPAGNPLFPNCPAGVATNCIGFYNVATSNPGQLPLDPAVLRVINLMPAPNNFTTGDGLNTAGFNFAAPQREKQYDFVVRGDYNINSNNTIYGRYSQGEQNTFGDVANGGLRRFPDTPDFVATFRNPKNLAVNYRSNITSNITNEFIFGINRFGFSFNNPDENFAQNPPFILNLPTDPLNNSPTVNNARRFTTYQYVDNLTFIRGAHTFKTGINFRFQRHLDDRRALTTLQAFFTSTGDNAPNLTTFGISALPGLNATDRSRLQSVINDLLGRVNSVGRSFVAGSDAQYLPAGEGLIYDARYREYDLYAQDTWKILPNLTIDLGLRWELRPSPSSEGNPILAPDQLIRAGAAPSNNLRWNEGELFEDDFNNLAPSIGIAWDPQNDGKSSIRANYRLAYDRLNTFLISSAVFQTLPGLIFPSSTVTTATNQLLLRNGLPNLTPTRTPQELRQPPFSPTAAITVFDPDFEFPQTHQWALSYQRDIGFGLVAEANYIGRRGRNLTGGYDVNQVNLQASDPRCPGETFLAAFNSIRANTTNVSCLINYLVAGQNMTNAGTTSFRTTFATAITQGSVASTAQTLSSTAVTVSGQQRQAIAERGFSPFFFQPFPQFPAGLNVIDSNDYSNYHGLELILKRRFSQGVSFQASYTLSRSKDTRSFDPAFTVVARGGGQTASSTPFNILDRSLNYAISDFDRKHVFQALFLAELPFGRGKQFGTDIPRVLDFLVGGWQLSGTVLKATGRPFTVYSGLNTFSNAVQSTANCNGCRPDMGRLIQEQGRTFWFSEEQRALFSVPAPGEQGNTPRNFFRGPGTFNLDLALAKKFRFTETRYLEFRFEAQNVTNTPTFGFPTAITPPTTAGNTFGRINDTVISFSRKAQIGLKLYF